MVVSSYGSILAITDFPKEVLQNLKVLQKEGMYGEYGFYEAIDYTPERLKYGQNSAVVKTYMAHHQALILLSINNLINDNILQNRFMKNPEIEAVDILLQERMPSDMLITKEKKEKTKKKKFKGYDNYIENRYTNIEPFRRKCNVLSGEDYLIEIDDKGNGYSKYKDILINKYKETSDVPCGIFFYIRNLSTGDIWKANYENGEDNKYEAVFSEDKAKFTKVKNGIESSVKITTGSALGSEIRSIKLKNNLEKSVDLEVISYFRPVLSRMEDDISHPAFNNLFLKYKRSKSGDILVKRNARGEGEEFCLGTNLFVENYENSSLEYEIDEAKIEDVLKRKTWIFK